MKTFICIIFFIPCCNCIIVNNVKPSDMDNEETKQEILEAGCPFKSTKQLLVQNICLMPNYHSNVPPNGLYTKTNVFISLDGAHILEVDEKNNKFTIHISENLQWLEPRMRTNFSKVPKDVKMIKLSEDNFYQIWHPEKDMYILNILEKKTLHEPKLYKDLVVIKDEETRKNASLIDAWKDWRATIFCPFDFSDYPFDTQRCEFAQKTDTHTKTFLIYYFPQNTTKLVYDAIGYRINISLSGPFIGINDELWNVETGTDKIGFNITLRRIFKPYLYKYYFPCITIVIVSQISFIIPLSAIPGRVGLIVTQFLTLVNIFIHQLVSIFVRKFAIHLSFQLRILSKCFYIDIKLFILYFILF